MVVEYSPLNQNFVDLRGRDFRGLNSRFVSRQGASLDPGTNVSLYFSTIAVRSPDLVYCNRFA
jgi:hypothetical protein